MTFGAAVHAAVDWYAANVGPWFTAALFAAGCWCAADALMTKQRGSAGAVLWIVGTLCFPWIGVPAYLTFGADRVARRRRARIRTAMDSFRREARRPEAPLVLGGARTGTAVDLSCRYPGLWALGDSGPSGGNAVKVFVGGTAAYAAMLDTIRGAQTSVALQIYILDDDTSGRRFRDALIERANAGVAVRLLYDSVGCIQTGSAFFAPLLQAGAKVSSFLPFHPLKRRLQVNLRNHRKILVVDGAVAFAGSMNLSDRHCLEGVGGSRDLMLKVTGPAARELALVFANDWRFASGEAMNVGALVAVGDEPGENTLQVIDSGPEDVSRGLHKMIVAAIYAARREVFAITPYFIPPESLFYALQTAAWRGVRVRLLVPHKTHPAVMDLAMRQYLDPLLRAEGEIAEKPGAMLHMKLMLIDDSLAFVGSSNLDTRSFYLNFESDLVVYGGPVLKDLRAVAEAEWSASVLIPKGYWAQLPVYKRALVRIAALFSPIL